RRIRCACMTARGLSLLRREPGISSDGNARLSALHRGDFSDVPALYYRCFLDPAAMAALGVKTPGTPASSSHGAIAIRSGDATPFSAFRFRLSRRLPS